MFSNVSLKVAGLKEFLLDFAPVRPVFVWGAPGIGKSAIIEQFANELGLPFVSLLGSQLAPEDLIGVPKIENNISFFCPPSLIAKTEPYCLFLDELNACSQEVQKAFYSLILEKRVGDYKMPKGSIIIGAGNRQQDSAIVKPMSSALINRLLHVHLEADAGAWMEWAQANEIHPLILDYLSHRSDHLWSQPSKSEEAFSTPRSWHFLSDFLKAKKELNERTISLLAYGLLTKEHASQFIAYYKQVQDQFSLHDILKGKKKWPREMDKKDVLYFLTLSFRDYLIKELPEKSESVSGKHKELAHKAKSLIVDLADISAEMVKIIISDKDKKSLPGWFLIEIARDLPRIVAA